jgi:GTP-binding protein
MPALPKIAIVGRPNVGKSALFNRICKKKIAIVDEAEGVTRDRIYQKSDCFGRPFEVIDTGGIDPRSKADFNEHIKQQAEIAIEEADSIILVVDGTVGVTPLDLEVAKILQRTKKPLCLAVNKVDSPFQTDLIYPFMKLGIKTVIPVSATQNWHIAELLEASLNPLPVEEISTIDPSTLRIAIVGRPNVGKSSLVNYLLSEERCVVSPIPGTTRDSVDVTFTYEGQVFTLVDTAGIRKKKSEHEVVEKFAAIRSQRAIENADICFLMLDAKDGLTAHDKRIAREIEDQGKGCVLLFNKWDLVKGFRMEHCLQGIEQEVPFLLHCPKVFLSATTGRNVDKIFPLALDVKKASELRITTGQLNRFLNLSTQKYHPPMIQGKRLRIYYMAQIDIKPPRFVLFVNYPNLMLDTYKKYLMNQFREFFSFTGVPIVFYLKGKKQRELPDSTPETSEPYKRKSSKKFEEVDDDEFSEEEFLFEEE